MPKEDKKYHVTIIINGVEYQVHKGNHPVVELKNLGKVPPEHILNLVKEGEQPPLIPLDHHDHVSIEGGEVFASHQPSGAAA